MVKESPRLAGYVFKEWRETKLTYGALPAMVTAANGVEKHCDNEVMDNFFRIICEGLYIKKSDFLFPSAFAVAFYENCSTFTVDKESRAMLFSLLSSLFTDTPTIMNLFLGAFIRKFSSKLLAHILHVLVNDGTEELKSLEERYASTVQSTSTVDFKQTMHFIGGSNVKSVLRTALSIKKPNSEWKKVIDTIRTHFLISDFSQAPEPELIKWTFALDRGN